MKPDLIDTVIVNKILSPKYIYDNVPGSPFNIGEKIIIKNPHNNDLTFEKRFVGKTGTIIFFEYNCGCGQTFPEDPMIGVKFSNGEICEFWKEEVILF